MNINIMAPINPLGYGQVGWNVTKQLHLLGHKVSMFPIGQISPEFQEDTTIIQEIIDNTRNFDYNTATLRIFHQNKMAERIGKGKSIGWPIFELNKFNEEEKNHLNSLDHIIVCSNWAKEIVEKEVPGILVSVVPLGVNLEIFNRENHGTANGEIFRFYNCGKTEIRKGHDILLELFEEAFPTEEDVNLCISWDNPFQQDHEKEEWKNFYKNSPVGHKIHFYDRVNTQMDVARLMSSHHCGIFPSRAEGFNLELLEMMALGIPVITTDYSAHTEFCNSSNSRLVQIDELESANDGVWFDGSGEWAKIGQSQKDQFVTHMRKVYHDWKYGNDITNLGGIETAKKMTWKHTAEKVEEILK